VARADRVALLQQQMGHTLITIKRAVPRRPHRVKLRACHVGMRHQQRKSLQSRVASCRYARALIDTIYSEQTMISFNAFVA
jgi:hypothetical protein